MPHSACNLTEKLTKANGKHQKSHALFSVSSCFQLNYWPTLCQVKSSFETLKNTDVFQSPLEEGPNFFLSFFHYSFFPHPFCFWLVSLQLGLEAKQVGGCDDIALIPVLTFLFLSSPTVTCSSSPTRISAAISLTMGRMIKWRCQQ